MHGYIQCLILAITLLLAGCALPEPRPATAPPDVFSAERALVHVRRLAGDVGIRTAGSEAAARAANYILDQFIHLGIAAHVQSGEGISDLRRGSERTGQARNVIGTLSGRRPEGIAIVAHYDTKPGTPGAADDAMGIGVMLETARWIQHRGIPEYTLYFIATDAEEQGLIGAAAFARSAPEVRAIQFVINLEAAGGKGPVHFFQTGPGSRWVADLYARAVRRPVGNSFAHFLWTVLPNDSDFTILAQRGMTGVNLASVNDAYVYHQGIDTPERLSPATVQHMGDTVTDLLPALMRADLTHRDSGRFIIVSFFRKWAVTYGPVTAWLLTSLGSLLAALAVWRRRRGWLSPGWPCTLPKAVSWYLVGLFAGSGLAALLTLGLRAVTGLNSPWFAYPLPFGLMLTGLTLVWPATWNRLGRRVAPTWAAAAANPDVIWALHLGLWTGLAVLTAATALATSYLFHLPLLGLAAAGLWRSAPGAGLLLAVASTALVWYEVLDFLLMFLNVIPAWSGQALPVLTWPAFFTLLALLFLGPLLAKVTARGENDRRLPLAAGWTAVATLFTAAAVLPPFTTTRPLPVTTTLVHDLTLGTSLFSLSSFDRFQVTGALYAGPISRDAPELQILRSFELRAATARPDWMDARTVTTDLGGGRHRIIVTPHFRRQPYQAILLLPEGSDVLASNVPTGRLRRAPQITYSSPPPDGLQFDLTVRLPLGTDLSRGRLIALFQGLPPDADAPAIAGPVTETRLTAVTAHLR